MYISKQSKAYVEKVIQNDFLMGLDVCTAVMANVVDFIGSGVSTKVENYNSSLDGIYSLCLNFCGDINTKEHTYGWEHGVAIQKLGDDIVVYQGWVSKFTLSNWMMQSGNVTAYPANQFAPLHAKNSNQGMKQWVLDLLLLHTFDQDPDEFGKRAAELFGPPCGGASLLALRMKQDAKLRYHWKHRALKPIEEIVAPNPIVQRLISADGRII